MALKPLTIFMRQYMYTKKVSSQTVSLQYHLQPHALLKLVYLYKEINNKTNKDFHLLDKIAERITSVC